MPLKQIMQLCGPEIGVNIDSDLERSLFVNRINQAAEELYGMTDLVGSLMEQVFDIDPTNQQIALPYYVGILRGTRNYEQASKRKLEDMRPRYFFGAWRQKYAEWRVKEHISALGRELSQDGKLTIVLAEAESEDFTLYINGATDVADRKIESLIIPDGEISVETVNNFISYPEIRLLEKSRATSSNITISDAAGIDISFIANSELRSRFTIVQVNDINDLLSADGCNCYEMLYKLKFTPFSDDYSEFPCEGYDDAIAWLVMSHYFAKKGGEDNVIKALGFKKQVQSLVRQREEDASKGRELKIETRPNRFIQSMENHCYAASSYPHNF